MGRGNPCPQQQLLLGLICTTKCIYFYQGWHMRQRERTNNWAWVPLSGPWELLLIMKICVKYTLIVEKLWMAMLVNYVNCFWWKQTTTKKNCRHIRQITGQVAFSFLCDYMFQVVESHLPQPFGREASEKSKSCVTRGAAPYHTIASQADNSSCSSVEGENSWGQWKKLHRV